MVYLICGGTHTGKTALALRLVHKKRCFCVSEDHLKMGLIRAGLCALRAEDSDEKLTEYLWPIVREMVKTCVENGQDAVIEGCYIPFDYRESFSAEYIENIRGVWLIFSESYIDGHYADITAHANDSELRLEDGYCTRELLISENSRNLRECSERGLDFLLIDGDYEHRVAELLGSL